MSRFVVPKLVPSGKFNNRLDYQDITREKLKLDVLNGGVPYQLIADMYPEEVCAVAGMIEFLKENDDDRCRLKAPESVVKSLKECSRRFAVVPMNLLCKGKRSMHRNSLIFDRETKTLTRFEPYGDAVDWDDVNSGLDEWMHENFSGLFTRYYQVQQQTQYDVDGNNQIIYTSGAHPVDFSEMFKDADVCKFKGYPGYCVTISLFLVHLRLANPQMTVEELMNHVASYGENSLRETAVLYMNFMSYEAQEREGGSCELLRKHVEKAFQTWSKMEFSYRKKSGRFSLDGDGSIFGDLADTKRVMKDLGTVTYLKPALVIRVDSACGPQGGSFMIYVEKEGLVFPVEISQLETKKQADLNLHKKEWDGRYSVFSCEKLRRSAAKKQLYVFLGGDSFEIGEFPEQWDEDGDSTAKIAGGSLVEPREGGVRDALLIGIEQCSEAKFLAEVELLPDDNMDLPGGAREKIYMVLDPPRPGFDISEEEQPDVRTCAGLWLRAQESEKPLYIYVGADGQYVVRVSATADGVVARGRVLLDAFSFKNTGDAHIIGVGECNDAGIIALDVEFSETSARGTIKVYVTE